MNMQMVAKCIHRHNVGTSLIATTRLRSAAYAHAANKPPKQIYFDWGDVRARSMLSFINYLLMPQMKRHNMRRTTDTSACTLFGKDYFHVFCLCSRLARRRYRLPLAPSQAHSDCIFSATIYSCCVCVGPSTLFGMQVTESDDIDKKKIKVEDAPDDHGQQTALHEASTSPGHIQAGNQSQEIMTSEIGGQPATLSVDTVTSAALPTTVITTQRHRMITTAGQIR